MKVYVASSWKNTHQQNVVYMLRGAGFEVYDFKNPDPLPGFSWSEIDENWQDWSQDQYTEALSHHRAIQGFNSDFDAMESADCCVMVLPCGRSAHTEAGWMKGAGKPTLVFMPKKEEPELMYKIYDDICTTYKEMLEWAKNREAEIIYHQNQIDENYSF